MTTTSARFPGMTVEQSKLLTWFCNAYVTSNKAPYQAKAAKNARVASSYREKLKQMGIDIPKHSELIELGVFNGEGSV